MTEAYRSSPSESTLISVDHLHGAAARIAKHDTAFYHRDIPFIVLINANWSDARDDHANITWVRETFTDLDHLSQQTAKYVNYLDADDEDASSTMFGANVHRLLNVKQKYDPDNFFRRNPGRELAES